MYMVNPESSVDQLKAVEKLRRISRGIKLYQAGDEPYEFKFDGERFVIPPDGPWQGPDDDKVEMHDGTLTVDDIYGVPAEAIRKARKKNKHIPLEMVKIPQTTLRVQALALVEHALKYSGGRVVCLVGGPEEIEALKKQARAIWLQIRYQTARQNLASFHSRNDMLMKAGHRPELMDDRLSKDQMFLDDYLSGNFSRKAFVCPDGRCGFQCDDAETMKRHVAASHELAQAQKATTELIGQESDGMPKPRRQKVRPEATEASA